MSVPKFRAGWDAERVKRLIDHYEGLSEDEMVMEDEAAMEDRDGQTVITVPDELLPAIRHLLANHQTARSAADVNPACGGSSQ